MLVVGWVPSDPTERWNVDTWHSPLESPTSIFTLAGSNSPADILCCPRPDSSPCKHATIIYLRSISKVSRFLTIDFVRWRSRRNGRPTVLGFDSAQPCHTDFSQLPQILTAKANSRRQKCRKAALDALNLAKEMALHHGYEYDSYSIRMNHPTLGAASRNVRLFGACCVPRYVTG